MINLESIFAEMVSFENNRLVFFEKLSIWGNAEGVVAFS